MSLIDEIAELLLQALARPDPLVDPNRRGFVYVARGGEADGQEILIEKNERGLADLEANQRAKVLGCVLTFVRAQHVAIAPRRRARDVKTNTKRRKRRE